MPVTGFPGGDGGNGAAGWVSAHVFHRGSADKLITLAVAPALEELSHTGIMDEFFFLRYWEGGPHLRLRLRPTRPGDAEAVRDVLLARCTRYLTEHPSPPAPATHIPGAYQDMARRWALAERLPRYDSQLHPDDTVEFIPYRPEYAAYGQRPALSAVETHFAQSSAIALRLITAGAPADQRHAAALGMLMLTLAVCEPDLARAARRARAAPADHIPQLAPPGPGARALRDSYAHHREALHAQARDLWAQARRTRQPPLSGPLAAWLSSIRALRDQLTTEQARGRFAPQDSLSPLTRLSWAITSRNPTVAQVLLRCAHLLCNRLGIHGAAEAHLASLLTRTLTDLNPEK